MKHRNDFVTNSSSSSFVCDICEHIERGYNTSCNDFYFYRCSEGHLFCQEGHDDKLENDIEHVKKNLIEELLLKHHNLSTGTIGEIKKCQMLFDIKDILQKYHLDGEWEYPNSLCPICQNIFVTNNDISVYKSILLKKTDVEIEKEILKRFRSYNELRSFLDKEMRIIENKI